MSFLFVDRIVESIPGKEIRGVKYVTGSDIYLYQQNQSFSFIPSLIGETLGQLAAWNVMDYHDFKFRPVAGIVNNATLQRDVYLGETLLLEAIITELDETAVSYDSIAKVEGQTVFSVNGAIGPFLPLKDLSERTLVQQQFAEINRPDDWQKYVNLKKEESAITLLPNKFDVTHHFSFDKISLVNDVYCFGKKYISRAAPYFPDHFPKQPVLPLTVLLECKVNLAKFFIRNLSKQKPGYEYFTVRSLRRIKMSEFIRTGDIVVCHLRLKRENAQEIILNCQSYVDEKRICTVDIIMESQSDLENFNSATQQAEEIAK